jgi:hypothetical protein
VSDAGGEPPRDEAPPGDAPGYGPPWRWRSDHGGHVPWASHDPEVHWRMRHRAQMMRGRRGGPWRFRQGFGCIFGILFLIVVASMVTAVGSVLSHLGPIPVVIAALVVVAIVAALARGMSGAARDLDMMVAATRRVEDGDYSVRVGRPRSDLPPIQELARGFDTMAARLTRNNGEPCSPMSATSCARRSP